MKNLIILSLLFLASCSTPQPGPSVFSGTYKYEPNASAAFNIDHNVFLDLKQDLDNVLATVHDKDSTYKINLSQGSNSRYVGRYQSSHQVELILYTVDTDLHCFYMITEPGKEAKGFISKLKRIK